MGEQEYMNAAQLRFFQQRLMSERQNLVRHIAQLKAEIQKNDDAIGDEADKAMREEELRFLFRQIDRESRLLPKYDAALNRIDDPQATAHALSGIPGVMEHGLFVGLAHSAIVAGPDGIKLIERS